MVEDRVFFLTNHGFCNCPWKGRGALGCYHLPAPYQLPCSLCRCNHGAGLARAGGHRVSCECSPAAPAAPGVRDQTPPRCSAHPQSLSGWLAQDPCAGRGSWDLGWACAVSLCLAQAAGRGVLVTEPVLSMELPGLLLPAQPSGCAQGQRGLRPKASSFMSLQGRRSCLEKPLLPVCEGQRHFPKPCRGSSSHWHMAGEARTWTPGL